MNQEFRTHVEQYVRDCMADHNKEHDFDHVLRVRENALLVARSEGIKDLLTVEVASLLHNIKSIKYCQDSFFRTQEIWELLLPFMSCYRIYKTLLIIDNVAWEMEVKPLYQLPYVLHFPELSVVRDADRLDAMGATGLVRAFMHGGERRGDIHSVIQYCKDHLLFIKDRIHTPSAKFMAVNRHHFMLHFLKRLCSKG